MHVKTTVRFYFTFTTLSKKTEEKNTLANMWSNGNSYKFLIEMYIGTTTSKTNWSLLGTYSMILHYISHIYFLYEFLHKWIRIYDGWFYLSTWVSHRYPGQTLFRMCVWRCFGMRLTSKLVDQTDIVFQHHWHFLGLTCHLSNWNYILALVGLQLADSRFWDLTASIIAYV